MVKDGIFLGKRYEVLSKIGAGGMADVYKGRDTKLNRYVAIKVLKKEFREDEDFVRKFRSEAQSAAGLMNPNIVNVYDVGEDRGLYYMVMELVEGITLKEYIERKGRLSHKEVISIAIQMCTGIGAAHAAGIIHRDIKPQNVIISKDGKVKVTDFGIAKSVTSNTISSNAMGSVHYTSPEQARGGFSDAKSDIYSIGITLFEMVTGEVPFDGDSTVSVAIKHLQEEITPPSELVPDIPYSLEQIILKCTQKNAERRYKSTDDLIRDLKRSLVDPDGDFVVIPPLRNADTVIITDEELDDIRDTYGDEDEDEYGDEYDEDEYGDEDEDEYGEDEYDVDEYGEDDEDEYGKGRKGGEDVNPRMNKVMKILMIVVAVIIIFIIIFAIGRAAGIFQTWGSGTTAEESESRVKVPNVVGMTEEEAKEALNEKGLGYKATYAESEKYEKGIVCEQNPADGERVEKNTTVEVVVSSKLVGEEITVPDVSGMDEESAQRTLEDEGLTVGTSEFVYSSDYAEGQVIKTTPAAGSKVGADTQIIMQVSRGEEKISVPDVRGQEDSEAQNALKNAGLSIGNVTYQYDNSTGKGLVISQSIGGGEKVSSGTSIDLVVSNGPKPEEKVTVKSFVGESESALIQWANSNGINIRCEGEQASNNYAYGAIISQSPSSGSVSKGSTITYVLSTGPEQTSGGEDNDEDDQ